MVVRFPPFSTARLPEIRFGSGRFSELPGILADLGPYGVLVTGGHSFAESGRLDALRRVLEESGVEIDVFSVTDEPDPARIDRAVSRFTVLEPRFVVAIGGGSALDAGKAIAGLLPGGQSVMDFLEGVGKGLKYSGPALPMIAVPTTAGTGSEATRNAVIGHRGPQGFKKSFRDVQLTPRIALVDPDLLSTCPQEVIAANGMDALTQLLEGYVSIRASAFTDALAESGLSAVREGLAPMYHSRASDGAARDRMAWAALASGMVLAHAGLGAVHGLASPLGAMFPIPHGVACGALVAQATGVNIRALGRRSTQGIALEKYRRAAELLLGRQYSDTAQGCLALTEHLAQCTRELGIERLSHYHCTESDIPRLVAGARGNSMQTNPVVLEDGEIAEIVERCL